ncbi:hypothetical protein JCM8547_006935 [Rhodosporidiobolus lusitaniae]
MQGDPWLRLAHTSLRASSHPGSSNERTASRSFPRNCALPPATRRSDHRFELARADGNPLPTLPDLIDDWQVTLVAACRGLKFLSLRLQGNNKSKALGSLLYRNPSLKYLELILNPPEGIDPHSLFKALVENIEPTLCSRLHITLDIKPGGGCKQPQVQYTPARLEATCSPEDLSLFVPYLPVEPSRTSSISISTASSTPKVGFSRLGDALSEPPKTLTFGFGRITVFTFGLIVQSFSFLTELDLSRTNWPFPLDYAFPGATTEMAEEQLERILQAMRNVRSVKLGYLPDDLEKSKLPHLQANLDSWGIKLDFDGKESGGK